MCHAHARPCLSAGWALNRRFGLTAGTAAVLAQGGGGGTCAEHLPGLFLGHGGAGISASTLMAGDGPRPRPAEHQEQSFWPDCWDRGRACARGGGGTSVEKGSLSTGGGSRTAKLFVTVFTMIRTSQEPEPAHPGYHPKGPMPGWPLASCQATSNQACLGPTESTGCNRFLPSYGCERGEYY